MNVGDIRYNYEMPVYNTGSVNRRSGIFALQAVKFTAKGDMFYGRCVEGRVPSMFGSTRVRVTWGFATREEAEAAYIRAVQEAIALRESQISDLQAILIRRKVAANFVNDGQGAGA